MYKNHCPHYNCYLSESSFIILRWCRWDRHGRPHNRSIPLVLILLSFRRPNVFGTRNTMYLLPRVALSDCQRCKPLFGAHCSTRLSICRPCWICSHQSRHHWMPIGCQLIDCASLVLACGHNLSLPINKPRKRR